VAKILYHVTSSLNRASIAEHGLDWRRAPAEQGIAGSSSHEEPGVFLARDPDEADWFVDMGKRRVARGLRRDLGFDVWEVTIDQNFDPELEDPHSPVRCLLIDGFLCWREPIPAARLRLIKQDL
jgi:hypothetical protein